jgi:nucleotide-binding universal stress UspA family protein
MYEQIYVPVDNSPYSNRAIEIAVELGARLESKLVGSHVYAAKMHDYRFKQMEFTLPEEYLQEQELERQRKIHDSLITMGLELISDSYLDQMKNLCEERKVPFEGKMIDGKHYVEIIKDIDTSGYDLTILGGQGIGKVRDSELGSVATQVTRHVNRDIWVVKDYKNKEERDTILVAIDGSPKSFGGLRTAFRLAKLLNKKIEIIGVYDPYLHYSVFSGIVDVLSEKAKKVFRFEEQNQLHEEIIDTGLAAIYQSHLNVAESIAQAEGIEVTKTLLDGKAFQKILDHARKLNPYLLIMGRVGVHSEEGEVGLGNTTENLLRQAPCDVYLCAKAEIPSIDLKAEEAIRWTDEALERMERVPSLVRGIARTGILRLAIEQGHSVITDSVISEAMERFMPKRSDVSIKVAEAIAFERAQAQQISMCANCGITAKEENPARCSVCGKTEFKIISKEMIDKIAENEGGVEEDSSYDGRKLKWSREARLELRGISDAYQRRRTKARVEKTARVRRLETITLDHVQDIIREELGNLPINVEREQAVAAEPVPQPQTEALPLVGTDEAGNELRSALSWEQDALTRMLNVPAGFMRERTQGRVEEVARESGADLVTLAMVEKGLERGRQMMNELLQQSGGFDELIAGFQKQQESGEAKASGGCPFHAAQQAALADGDEKKTAALNEVTSVLFPNGTSH